MTTPPKRLECYKCHEFLAPEEFYKDASKARGRQGYCKGCQAVRDKVRPRPDQRDAKAEWQKRKQRPCHAERQTLKAMKKRCYNANHISFKWYGAKGVTICDRWLNSFEAFYADMGPRPSKDHSIDRIDPYGNYEPGNCRWATKQEQRANQRQHVGNCPTSKSK